jgi:hypothetical protein
MQPPEMLSGQLLEDTLESGWEELKLVVGLPEFVQRCR